MFAEMQDVITRGKRNPVTTRGQGRGQASGTRALTTRGVTDRQLEVGPQDSSSLSSSAACPGANPNTSSERREGPGARWNLSPARLLHLGSEGAGALWSASRTGVRSVQYAHIQVVPNEGNHRLFTHQTSGAIFPAPRHMSISGGSQEGSPSPTGFPGVGLPAAPRGWGRGPTSPDSALSALHKPVGLTLFQDLTMITGGKQKN